MEVALSPWLVFHQGSHSVQNCTSPEGCVFKDVKNGADLRDVCPFVLPCTGFTGHPCLELSWSVGRQYVHKDSSVVLEEDAWYFGCSFL